MFKASEMNDTAMAEVKDYLQQIRLREFENG